MSDLSTTDTFSGSLSYAGERQALLDSLRSQQATLADSIVLTPVDSLPFSLADREHTAFLHGLYLTDKNRDEHARRTAPILFGGREQAVRDLSHIHGLVADALGAAVASLRLLSGLHAHVSAFMSISKPGQTVMLLPEPAGGHFSTQAILERLGLHIIDIPINYEQMCVDEAETLRLLRREAPDFVFIDRSEGLRYEDFAFFGELERPRTIFDASQYLPQILVGRYENPLSWGFDLMLFSLHKSFPGPQKAGVVSRENDTLWADLLAGLSQFVSSSHAENSYLAALALLRREWLETYVERLLGTAHELEQQLLRRGLSVVPRSRQGAPHWPGTHHIWLTAPSEDVAFAQFELLSQARLHVNYRKLPYGLGFGLRLGTTHSAVAGIGVSHVEELADLIDSAIAGDASDALRQRVRDLAQASRVDAIVPSEYWE